MHKDINIQDADWSSANDETDLKRIRSRIEQKAALDRAKRRHASLDYIRRVRDKRDRKFYTRCAVAVAISLWAIAMAMLVG